MKAICYKNTKTNLPGWIDTVHIEQKYGYAYETPTHYVHFYGKESFYIISVGLTVTEAKTSYATIEEWVKYRFGAEDIQEMTCDVGHVLDGIWRPSLYYWSDICTALQIDAKLNSVAKHIIVASSFFLFISNPSRTMTFNSVSTNILTH